MSSRSQSSHSENQSDNEIFNNLAPDQPKEEKQVKQTSTQPIRQRQVRRQQTNIIAEPTVDAQLISRITIPTQNRPRLIIEKIVLENFKSYADTQTIGPFHQNFTSVVGPNGSGKSNLIESMLFIFGYKANWMRLKSLNQLIHNSSTMGSVDKASVQVQFKKIIQSNDGKIIELPHESFTLRRTVKSSGESKYFLNGNASTATEVKTKLKEQGIDLNNNRFLILQGEVEQISQMKQKSGDREKPGLLEYLEDIIGSNVYIVEIEQGVSQYNKTEEIKHEKGQMMKLAEVELKTLNKGKQEAIKFVKKQRQIYQIHNILQQVIISNSKYESKDFKQRLGKAETQRDRIINEQKQKLKKQAERIRQIKKNRTQIEGIQKQLVKQGEAMNKMITADKHINQEISFKSQDSVKYSRKEDDLKAQLAKIINESDQVKQSLPKNKEKFDKLKIELEEMEQQLQKHDKPELKQKLKNLQNQLKKIEHEIKSFQQKQKSAQRNFDEKFKRTEKNELKELELKRAQEQESETLEKICQAEIEANKIKTTLQNQLNQTSNKLKQARAELEKVSSGLREQQNQKKEIGQYNDMFERIMQQNFPGVIGRLGDLGSIPKQYDSIITSSCSRLDNIVVKNMQAAQSVLNFLKANKLGRVTCIILDKIQDQLNYMSKPWNNLPNSTRLFDLIQPAYEQVKVAFYFAIGDTIYCENSQMGMEYSMKDERNRRRVISKKQNGGFIIYELNGLINGCLPRSGGFTVKAKSKMRPQDGGETKELEKSKQVLTKTVTGLQQKFRQVKGEFEGVQKDLDEFKREKRNIEHNLKQTRLELSDLIKGSGGNNKSLQQQKQKKQKELNSLANHINGLQKNKKDINISIQEIEKQQRSHENEKVIRMRDNYKISKQEYQLLDKDIQKKVAILETTLKRINQNKKSSEEARKKKQMLEREINKLSHQREQIENKATEILGKIKAGQQRIEACKKQEQKQKVLFEQEQKDVKESKLRIEKAKQEVEICKQKLKVFYDTIINAEQQLRKQRETYKQLSITYDFLNDIESIETMSVEDVKRNVEHQSKHDTSAILNQSIDISNTSSLKVFPLDKLLEASPFDDLSEDKLDPFLLFTQKMRTMLVTETQNLKKMTGSNLLIITEFKNKFLDFKSKHEEFQAVRLSQMQLKKKIEELKEKRMHSFREGFGIINSKLKQVYQLLTRGGDAQLELIDSLDPFSDGINFSVRPPKKAWKQINKLSGGEKTLSSLSLIFALHYYKPTPLYFMDEIDAALDFKNVSIVADYIKKRTKDAQFIIISLRNNMFELADKLVGVYKTYDKTKIVHFVPSKMRKNITGMEKQNMDFNQN